MVIETLLQEEEAKKDRRRRVKVGDYTLQDYFAAPSNGPLNAEWHDKPHRLIYDLGNRVEELDHQLRILAQDLGDFLVEAGGLTNTGKLYHACVEASAETINKARTEWSDADIQAHRESESASDRLLAALIIACGYNYGGDLE